MKMVEISAIQIGERQRKKIREEPLAELITSIQTHGLLHPPSIWTDPEGVVHLMVGGRRVEALRQLHVIGAPIKFDGRVLPADGVPCIELADQLTPVEKLEVEFDENEQREDLDWKERTEALAEIHAARQAVNPAQTHADTAKELQARQSEPQAINTIRKDVGRAVVVQQSMDIPEVAAAKNLNEAYSRATRIKENALRAKLAERRAQQMESEPTRYTMHHGDLRTVMPTLEPKSIDLLFVDPPYGIDAQLFKREGMTGDFRSEHHYDDSEQYARELLKFIIEQSWEITKPKANLLIFTDIKHFNFISEASERMGWTPWRTPIIWYKDTNEGEAPWGAQGFVRTTEMIFYATKGQRGLNSTHIDLLPFKRAPRKDREHGAVKPVPLAERLIDLTTSVGDRIFDPCAGAGSLLVAALRKNRYATGIELSKTYYEAAVANLERTSEAIKDASRSTETSVQDVPG